MSTEPGFDFDRAKLRVEQGTFHAYFIYDVADTIDLVKLTMTTGKEFERAQIDLRSLPSPAYIQFEVPPLSASLPELEIDGVKAEVRLKIYDYGTLSIRISFPCTGELSEFANSTRSLRQSEKLWNSAEELLSASLRHIEGALNKPHKPLMEEYFVMEVNTISPSLSAKQFLHGCKREISAMLLGENRALSDQEIEETLRVNFSYFESDLAVLQWDAAFVFDSREGAEAVESILEFANTQLVELRTYDARLDAELDEVYKWNLARSKPHWLFGRKAAAQQTDRLRNLLIDIRELSDRGNNALKIIGDAFYARLYRGISARLGLSDWQNQLESKLGGVAEIYHFATDQAQHTRSEFLEMIIIVLILIEIIMALFSLHL